MPKGGLKVPLSRHWGHVRFFIERKKSGFIGKKLTSTYKLYAGDFLKTKGSPMVYAKRVFSVGTSHFVISSREDDLSRDRSCRSEHYIGKLRSNKDKDEYCLYDNGVSSNEYEQAKGLSGLKDGDESEIYGREDIRRCLGVIIYRNRNEMSEKFMEASIPQIILEKDDKPWDWPDERLPGIEHEPLVDVFRRLRISDTQNIAKYDKIQCYESIDRSANSTPHALENFQHECTKSSVKNFQLVETKAGVSTRKRKGLDKEHVVLQFSKVSENVYSLDVQFPLSISQALGICLSRFDTNAVQH